MKNAKSSNMWSTFLRLSETHKKKFGDDVGGVWTKIKQMIENKTVKESMSAKAEKVFSHPEKSRKEYEKTWNEFQAFLEKDEEATEDDYMKYITYLAEEKHHKGGGNAHMTSANSPILNCHGQGQKLPPAPTEVYLLLIHPDYTHPVNRPAMTTTHRVPSSQLAYRVCVIWTGE